MTESQDPCRPLLVVATGNTHKTEEIRALLGEDFRIQDLSDYPAIMPPEETGSTFAENSALKAVGVSKHVEGLVLSDDSGLEVDALDGEPGVYSARYSGDNATDASNREKVLKELSRRDAPQPWPARFRCVMTIAQAGKALGSCEGTVEGVLVAEDRGQSGFGYDPIFCPEGLTETFGELPAGSRQKVKLRPASDSASMLPADYHMHTPLCRHADGWPIEYAARAQELGIKEIGFSDHAPFREERDDWRMLAEELPRYANEVDQARQAYPELTIRLGLEVDFLTGEEEWIGELSETLPYDYLIGSVHYLAPDWDFDNPKWIGRFEEQPVADVWRLYWQTYEKAIRSGLFDIMGHPDLVKKFGHRPDGDLRRYYEPAIEAMTAMDCAYEINTAGLRKAAAERYPHDDFVRLACAAGVPLTFGSDAHAPSEVGAGFKEAVSAAIEAGYTETARFEKRHRDSSALASSSDPAQ